MQLSQAEITQQNPHKYCISGIVDFSTVPDLARQSSDFIKNINQSEHDEVVIDLSQITACNSAALALMLEIAKHASSNNIKLHFENSPETLLTIAKAYGVESEINRLIHKGR